MSEKTFRPWEIDQTRLFPPSVRDFVPEEQMLCTAHNLLKLAAARA